MKRFLLTLCALCATTALWAATETVNGITWTYTVSNGEAMIGIGKEGTPAISRLTSGSIMIPSFLGGYPVTAIGDSAFWDCSNLTSIVVPLTVTSIGDEAFRHCSDLVSVTISPSVTSIGEDAFEDCWNLPKDASGVQYESPKKVVLIDVPRSWSGEFVFPDSVRFIHSAAFSDCFGVTSIKLPSGLTSIGCYAFNNCMSLSSITIPSGVTSIGESAFGECSRLKSIIFLGNPPKLVDDDVFPRTNGYYMSEHASTWDDVALYGWWKNLTMQKVDEKTVTITFDAAGGSGGGSETLDFDSKLTPPVVSREGYTFIGWKPEVPAVVPVKNTTYTAQWQKNEVPALPSPSWKVGNYQNNMVVYAQVKDIATGEWIEADGCLLAAFAADGACRGVVEAIDIGLEHKVYQLTVCSDRTSGEVLTLKIWNAETGKRIELDEKVRFEANSEVGLLWKPIVFEVVLRPLSLTLEPGWNQCLINIDVPAGTSVGEFFSGWRPINGDQVKDGTQTATYYNGAWHPSTFCIVSGKTYLIKNSAERARVVMLMGTSGDADKGNGR